MNGTEQVIRVDRLVTHYGTRMILRGIDMEIGDGEFTAVVGPSGSGKTTVMNLIGGLDVPTKGTVEVAGTDLSKLKSKKLSDMRLRNVGFVFQAYNLIPVLSAMASKQLVLAPLVTDRFPLSDACSAYQRISAAPGTLGVLQLTAVDFAEVEFQ